MVILARISADSSELKKELREASQKLKDFGKEVGSGAMAMAKWGAAASVAGAAMGAAFVAKGLEAVDAQAKLSKQLRTTTSSIATLERAGQLAGVSIQQIGTGARTLDKQLGDASRGVARAAENFDRLGLNIDEVTKMPLDQRINVINQAISKNIPLTEQAAVASELYGAKAAAAIRGMDTATLAEAARQSEIFGQNLSDIDAAKVELANDAISTMSNAVDGAQKQIAVKFAPVLQAIGEDFLGISEEAGGFGEVSERVFNNVITAVGFVLDAIHRIKVVFKIVADSLIVGMTAISTKFANDTSNLLTLADKVPGIDFSETIASVNQFAAEQRGIMEAAQQSIIDTWNEPLPSGALKKYVAEAEVASQAAAEAAAQARESMFSDEAGSNVVSFDDAKLEKIREQYKTEQQLLAEKYALEQETLVAALELQKITKAEFDALELESKQAHADALTAIEQKAAEEREKIAELEAKNRRDVYGGMMDNLSTLLNSGSKSQFEIGKKASLAKAAITGVEAAINAWNAGMQAGGPAGPAVAAAYMATSIATTAAKISAIRSQTFGGGVSQAAQGSAARSSGASAHTIEQQEQQKSSNMYVRGIDPNQMFSGQQLVELINAAQEQGAVLRVA